MASKKATQVFLNFPFDVDFEPLYVALVAALTAFGLKPRTVLEIPPQTDRLERLRSLIAACGSSIHDLSRVEVSGDDPVPRFNMPFELGLALGIHGPDSPHKWFVLESKRHRVARSLSDLSGYDVEIHEGSVEGILQVVKNAFGATRPLIQHDDLKALHVALSEAVPRIIAKCGSLFTHSAFYELVATGENRAVGHFARTTANNRTPVQPADDTDWLGLLYGIAQRRRAKISEEEISAAVANRHTDRRAFNELFQRVGGPCLDMGELYRADINNDGLLEYVLCDTNSTGLHNSWIVDIFQAHNAVVFPIPLPLRIPFSKPKSVYYFANPFLSTDREGTVVMNFSEGIGTKEKRASYLWTGKTIRLVERVPMRAGNTSG